MPDPTAVAAADADFSRRMQQVETLVGELERAPDPRLREHAQELVRVLLDLHKAGLVKMLEIVRTTDAGARISERLASDELVASLLLLHDLHPAPLEERVQRAIAGVQQRASRHGADVTLTDNRDGRAVVRIAAGAGCGSSVDTIREMVEQALLAETPDLTALEFEAAAPPAASAFISLQQLKDHRPLASPPSTGPAVAAAGRPR